MVQSCVDMCNIQIVICTCEVPSKEVPPWRLERTLVVLSKLMEKQTASASGMDDAMIPPASAFAAAAAFAGHVNYDDDEGPAATTDDYMKVDGCDDGDSPPCLAEPVPFFKEEGNLEPAVKRRRS